jgi:hypothetical protein
LSTVACGIDIGDRVAFDGRHYIVRGFTRGALSVRQVVLEDVELPTTVVTVAADAVEAVSDAKTDPG